MTDRLKRLSNHVDIVSPEQRIQYERDGYFVIPKLFTPNEIKVFIDRLAEIAENRVPRIPTMTVMRDITQTSKDATKKIGLANITKLQDFQDDPVLFSYCQHKKTLSYISSMIGKNIRTMHTMLIQKPPDIGESGVHPVHQDLFYFPFRPADKIIAIWTAMEKIDEENGCLYVIPGSHRFDLLPHSYPKYIVNKAYLSITEESMSPYKDMPRVPVIMDIGDTVIFHPLLFHESGWNRSNRYRKAISCHYASTDCYYINVDGTPQEFIKNEVEAMAKRRGFELEFNDVWKWKSRLVMGEDHTLV